MRILIVGSGAREHALAWKAARSPGVEKVLVAPGNAGTAREPMLENVAVAVDDFAGLTALARREAVALTIIGPEAPLVAGIRDAFDAAGLACFGPSAAAARLEGSKAFAKAFMQRHAIPCAASATFTDIATAEAHIRARGAPLVVKADGLAAGKGVTVARSTDEALDTARAMLSGAAFGESGQRIVIEELLEGEEASFICLCDGTRALPFASAQDHKPRDEGDRGPNTGGLGAYSPAPVVTPEIHERVMREVVEPTLRGMASEGHPYQGFLYVGLMITPEGAAKVIEFNCRFGDPEAEPILMRLDADLVDLCRRALAGDLSGARLAWDPRAALAVVMAAGGYPLDYAKGDPIQGLDALDGLGGESAGAGAGGEDVAVKDVKVFHAGTRLEGGRVVTDGGRVLCVVGMGDSVTEAQRRAYAAVGRIRWNGVYYRRDIGFRAVAREG